MTPTTSAAKCHHKVDPLMGVPGMERPPIESQAGPRLRTDGAGRKRLTISWCGSLKQYRHCERVKDAAVKTDEGDPLGIAPVQPRSTSWPARSSPDGTVPGLVAAQVRDDDPHRVD